MGIKRNAFGAARNILVARLGPFRSPDEPDSGYLCYSEAGPICYTSECPDEFREEFQDLYRISEKSLESWGIQRAAANKIYSSFKDGHILLKQKGRLEKEDFEEPIEITPDVRKNWLAATGHYGRVIRDITRDNGDTIVRVYPHWMKPNQEYARIDREAETEMNYTENGEGLLFGLKPEEMELVE